MVVIFREGLKLDEFTNEQEYAPTYGSKKNVKLASKLNPINKAEFNKSVYFVAPLIGITASYFNLMNSYLGDDVNQPDDKFSYIYINVRYIDEKLLGNEYFIEEYRLSDQTYMYKFSIPDEFKEDYLLFCDSKYSKLSNRCKLKLCKMSGVKDIEQSLLFKVLYKTPDRIQHIENLIGETLPYDAEVMSRIDLDKEIYDRK